MRVLSKEKNDMFCVFEWIEVSWYCDLIGDFGSGLLTCYEGISYLRIEWKFMTMREVVKRVTAVGVGEGSTLIEIQKFTNLM